MNTTKGVWHAEPYEHEEGHTGYMVIANSAHHSVADLGPIPEAEANANLIALAGNLNQRLDLSKLEAAIDLLAKAKQVVADRAAGGNMVTSKGYAQDLNFEIQDFLRTITRQPAGEKTTT